MEFKITEEKALILIGIKRSFNSDNSYEEIPKFWDEIMKSEDWKKGLITGKYGLCFEENGKNFSYMIADDYDSHKTFPEKYEKVDLPTNLYASFPCKGKIPETLQSINTKIWSEWVPNCKDYKLKGNYCLEVYYKPDYAEIMIPITKA